ncbi:MAG: hypothetical protein MI922_26420 [Bacteroidales bacterium]|nr:hypothetical protein [Bacteroidales bacterium]
MYKALLKNPRIVCATLMLVLVIAGYAQAKPSSSLLEFEFGGISELQYQYGGSKSEIKLMDATSDVWGNIELPIDLEENDNPMHHGAFYGLVQTQTSYKKKYSLLLDLLLEDRGISYGFTDMDNIVVLPLYQFEIREKLELFHPSIDVYMKAGTLLNHKIHNGLKIYNLDVQGWHLKAKWKNMFLEYNQVGDASFHVGLNLGELYEISLGYEHQYDEDKAIQAGILGQLNEYKILDEDTLLLHLFEFNQLREDVAYYNNFGVWFNFEFSKNSELYFQYELRTFPYENIVENSAFNLGYRYSYKGAKTELTFNPEFRYYGWVYNFIHRNADYRYRKINDNIDSTNLYANTTGRYIYPLMNFNRPFSQWAVYTDYQYQDIAGIELKADIQRKLANNFFINLKGVSCTLIKEYKYNNKKTFTYYFYSAEIVYSMDNIFEFRAGISNKQMNLDKQFQTFYMRKLPVWQFALKMDINSR